MAGLVCSAVVQETVSRGVSLVLGKRKEKACQGHMLERLEMAVSELEHALERSAKLPITDVSLLQRRKMFKGAYIDATELLDKHRQQAVLATQEQISQGVKRKRLTIHAKNLPIASSSADLNTEDVGRIEWFARCAGNFLRDVESGCSLRYNTFCNPIVRHLLEGKTLRYHLKQETHVRSVYMWPTYSEERGVEVSLGYSSFYKNDTITEKCFDTLLVLRLSESTDVVRIATECLQFLTSQFRLAAESAMGELTLLPNLLVQETAHSFVPPFDSIQERHTEHNRLCLPDPACCKARRNRLCGRTNVSSEFPHIFQEQVIFFGFICCIPELLEPRLRSSSSDEPNTRTSPLVVTLCFLPHDVSHDSFALEVIGNDANKECGDASVQEVARTIKSRAINCLQRHPELMEYRMYWYSKHGAAFFVVEKPRIERTRRRCSTRQGRYKGKKYVYK